ncbi:MAG: SpoIIE family protein phosphatase [Coprobacillaceae bacterium]
MDLLVERSTQREKNGTLLISMFVLSFLVSIITIYDNAISFALPLFTVAFCCGYGYTIAYFLAIVISSILIPESAIVLWVSIASFIVLQIGVYLRFVKVKYLGFIVAGISAIFLLFYQVDYISIAVIASLVVAHTYLFKELVPIFIHKTLDVYTNKRLMILSMVVMLCMTSLLQIEQIYMMVLLRFYIVLSIFYLGIQTTMPSMLYISIILILQSPILKDDVLSIVLPCSIFFMFEPKTKLKTVTIYILSHLILPFFISYDMTYHSITILVSGLLFLISPALNIKKEILNDEFKEVTNRNKLIQKANTFASLFRQLTTVFKETNPTVNSREYIGYMYEDVCSSCSSKEYCYHSKKGMSRLVKLVNKGIVSSYDEDDLDYIKEYCINPKEYVSNAVKLHDNYHRIVRVNQENQHLKNDLFYEFSLLGDIFDNFSSSISRLQIGEEHIKEHLEGYQFEISFLKQYRESAQTYTLEMGLMNITKREIEEELLPILETYLNETLDVVSIKDSMHHLGYTSLILKHNTNYVLQHGFQQFSLDPIACGDSYTVFHQNMDHYLAISDGMGQGKEASKESKLTLEILSKLVMNGIGLKDTLDSINTLLKIKNQSDMFTTLDLFTINLANARAKLVKYGAYSSFIISRGLIDEVDCKTLPVGVVSHIPMTSYETHLDDGDIVIMASDGVGDSFKQIVENSISLIEDQHPQEIATILMDRVLEERNLDDISIMAIKIVKQK